MKTPVETKPESTWSKLAFSFACWGLILAPLFAVPAIVFGHIGKKKDKSVTRKSRAADVALIMGYFEATVSIAALYFHFANSSGLSVSRAVVEELGRK